MPDDVTFTLNADSTPPNGTIAATDETTSGPHSAGAQMGISKLAVSANGDSTHVPATVADGLLVNLGANNDVTVTGTVTVDGSGVTQPVSNAGLTALNGAIAGTEVQVDVVGALPAGTNNIGDVDVLSLPALPAGTNNIGDVDIASLPNEGQQTMANSISVAVASDQSNVPVSQATASALNAQTVGNVAHDSADSGNPIKAGAKAVSFGTNPTGVAANDRTDLYANVAGVQFVIGGHPNSRTAVYNTTGAQTDDPVLAAIAGGSKYAITRISVSLDEAATVGVSVLIGFGTSTLPALGASGADGVEGLMVYHPGLVPGGVMTIGDGSGVLGVGADGSELRITCEAPTSGTLSVAVTFFTIES